MDRRAAVCDCKGIWAGKRERTVQAYSSLRVLQKGTEGKWEGARLVGGGVRLDGCTGECLMTFPGREISRKTEGVSKRGGQKTVSATKSIRRSTIRVRGKEKKKISWGIRCRESMIHRDRANDR